MFQSLKTLAALSLLLQLGQFAVRAADQPQWGQAWSRNMVSGEKGLPDSFDPKTGKNVKWSVEIGTETHSTPIIAEGRVYIGTNNQQPRDPNHTADSGVLMCFEETTGEFLWQLVVPKREEDIYHDWPKTGWSSPVTVEGDRVYVVSNRGEVMCLDAKGMADGNDGPYKDEAEHMIPRGTNAPTGTPPPPGPKDGDIIWLFDLTKEAGIWSHDGAHSSILIHGDYLYLNSGTGVDNTHKVIRTPDAPSLVVLDKKTGKLVARDEEHIAPDIFHCTWSSPSMGVVKGKDLIFFCAGNGMVYAFETLSGNSGTLNLLPPKWQDRNSPSLLPSTLGNRVQKLKKVWQFDFDPTAPKHDIHRYLSNRREGPSNLYGMPVVQDNRLYVAGGGDLWWGKNEAWLKCIDTTKADLTGTNGLIWSYPLEKHVLSTPAVHQGMIFIADCGRTFHCLDAQTGKPYWKQEIKGEAWASPLVADGKVYFGTRSGQFWVFAASKEKKVLSSAELGSGISATATAANGILYIATMNRLFALSSQSQVK